MSDSMKNLNTFKRNNKLTQPANPEVSHATYISRLKMEILHQVQLFGLAKRAL